MTIKQFAEQYNLTTSRDECGNAIIQGKLGHLYVDGGVLCAMWADAPPMNQSRLAKLGGACWQGDISIGANGRKVQDAWVRWIKPEAHEKAIQLVKAKSHRKASRGIASSTKVCQQNERLADSPRAGIDRRASEVLG
jgi:hypothetical protein